MPDRKKDPVWAAAPTVDDYAGGANYLSLTLDDDHVRAVISAIRSAKTVQYRAQDLLRAARLDVLSEDDPHVKDKIDLIKAGTPMPPVLLIQGDAATHRPLIVVDGWHRIAAVYARDSEGTIPCKMAPNGVLYS